MRTHYLLGWIASLTLLVAPCFAEDASSTLRDVTSVQNGRGAARVYFRMEPVAFSDHMMLDRAVLTIPYNGSAEDRSLELQICPITGSWAGWETPFDPAAGSQARLDLRREGVATFDLTVQLKEILEEGRTADGFVLTSKSSEGLASGDLLRLADLSGATLSVSTSALPTGRPPARRRQR